MRWAERSFSCFDNCTFWHLSSLVQHLLKSTPGELSLRTVNQREFQWRPNSPVTLMVGSDETWNSQVHQTSRTLSASSVHLRLSSTIPLSPSYIIRFAALLSLPAAFVFPSSSSSSSYFIPRIITPLTSELNTYSKSTPTSHHFFCPLRHPLKRILITTLIRNK